MTSSMESSSNSNNTQHCTWSTQPLPQHQTKNQQNVGFETSEQQAPTQVTAKELMQQVSDLKSENEKLKNEVTRMRSLNWELGQKNFDLLDEVAKLKNTIGKSNNEPTPSNQNNKNNNQLSDLELAQKLQHMSDKEVTAFLKKPKEEF